MKHYKARFLASLVLIVGYAIIASMPHRSVAAAQVTSAHSVTLNQAGAGAMDVYRAQGSCNTASAFSKVATGVTLPFTDTTVTLGSTYCYYLMTAGNVPSNFAEAIMPTIGSASTHQQAITATATVN